MDNAASSAKRTIAILSSEYLNSGFAKSEWTAAFAKDPTGKKGILLPVRIEECDIKGMLGQIVYIDLVGSNPDEAQNKLLSGVINERSKPKERPLFPKMNKKKSRKEPLFPTNQSKETIHKRIDENKRSIQKNSIRSTPPWYQRPLGVIVLGVLISVVSYHLTQGTGKKEVKDATTMQVTSSTAIKKGDIGGYVFLDGKAIEGAVVKAYNQKKILTQTNGSFIYKDISTSEDSVTVKIKYDNNNYYASDKIRLNRTDKPINLIKRK